MKKQIIITLILFSVSGAANASETFKTNAEINQIRRDKDAAAEQRNVEQLKASQDILAEMQKSNALNAEISAKLDKLLESSDANNVLMDTLLKRTE